MAVMFFDYGGHGFFVLLGVGQGTGSEVDEYPGTWIK